MKVMRDQLFLHIDQMLPRKVAIFPYELAFKSLLIRFSAFPDILIWKRNSILFGNFIFGISDLDLTLVIPNKTMKKYLHQIKSILNDQKKIYPFLGEANIFIQEDIEYFSSSANYYEKKRDPELCRLMPEGHYEDQVEKVVFLLRMFYSDKVKLSQNPELRQKKWQFHFQKLGIPVSGQILPSTIFTEILNLLALSSENSKKVNDVFNKVQWAGIQDHDVLEREFPEYWKFLFPHKYYWFKKGRKENFAEIRGTTLEKVFQRQLDWEIWGLFSQLPFLLKTRKGTLLHLDRLLRASWELGLEDNFREKTLKLIRRIKQL